MDPHMLKVKELKIPEYKRVIEGIDEENNLHCYIAIHDLTLGPSLGGVRIFPYGDPKEALEDVLRLSRGMTKKAALAEVGFGGGKSVIIADPRRDKNKNLLHAFAALVNTLGGQYITAEDVGSSTTDMETIREVTPYVSALPRKGSSGDPSPFTAWGVFRAIQATAYRLWGSPSLKGKKIAIQGLGNVGSKLSHDLFWSGADLILADVDKDKLEKYCYLFGAEAMEPEEILAADCDILAPCAMGGIINSQTIPALRCKAIAGAANNQLLKIDDGELLFQRNILYAPDYIINSGGLINVSIEYEQNGYDPKKARDKVDNIYKIILNIFNKSEKEHKSTVQVAEELWQYNIKCGIGKRTEPIQFK